MLPILILCFVRLDSLKECIDSILSQEHGPIYISCDAPPSEFLSQGAEVQKYIKFLLASGVVKEIRISESNQGILRGVTSGVSWFFERVEKGIILEDDLILQPNFLKSVELASKHLDHPKVIALGLHNSVPNEFISNQQAILRSSWFVISWGWVTTKDNWNSRIKTYQEVDYLKLLLNMLPKIGLSSTLYHIYYYRKKLATERTNIVKCTWADLWQINAFLKNSIVLTYNKNFVHNIGFDQFATNTKSNNTEYALETLSGVDFDDKKYHSKIQQVDQSADRYFAKNRKISTIVRGRIQIRTRMKEFRRRGNLKSRI